MSSICLVSIVLALSGSAHRADGLTFRVFDPNDDEFASQMGSLDRVLPNLEKKLAILVLQKVKNRGDTTRLPASIPAVISP